MSDYRLFQDVEKKTGVQKNQIMQLVNALKYADLSDETTVRNLVQSVATLAGKSIPKEKENQLVKAVIRHQVPSDLSSLSKLMD